MIDQSALDDLVDTLAAMPARLREVVSDASADELSRAAVGGGWGPVEVFCHLRDLENLFIERVTRILDEDDPYLQTVDETLWPIERDYAAQNPWQALEQFSEHRQDFVRILSGLDASQWLRRGYHQDNGEQTVLWYAQHAAEHDAMHEQQLRGLLERGGVGNREWGVGSGN